VPRLLDLFCGAGGAAMGYHRAGFDVVGVDIVPQPNYPFEFVEADAIEYLSETMAVGFDAIHASPPCQAYTQLGKGDHPRLIEPTRAALTTVGLPWIIENVVGAPLLNPVLLCGSAFGLGVRRHRLFESSELLFGHPCKARHPDPICAYYGKKGWLVWTAGGAKVQREGRRQILRGSVAQAPADMGIDWMQTWDEVREAIPPAYTEWIGRQLIASLERVA
jgi:DNA (cytosine-5)-methyltransferase 1